MGFALRSPAVAVLTEVDCVVVSYNSAADLPTCIDSLTSQEGMTHRWRPARCALFSGGLRQKRPWAVWDLVHSTATAPSIRVGDPFPAQ